MIFTDRWWKRPTCSWTCGWASTLAACCAASSAWGSGSTTCGPTTSRWPTTWRRAANQGEFMSCARLPPLIYCVQHKRSHKFLPSMCFEIRILQSFGPYSISSWASSGVECSQPHDLFSCKKFAPPAGSSFKHFATGVATRRVILKRDFFTARC